MLFRSTGPVVDPWDISSGWRPGEPAWMRWLVAPASAGSAGAGASRTVAVRGTPDAASVRIDDLPATTGAVAADGDDLLVTLGGITRRWSVAVDGETVWLGLDGRCWALREVVPTSGRAAAATSAEARSPMPGTVVALPVAAGETVAEGQAVAVVEAMKMEHTVAAPHAGVVKDVLVRVGEQVALDQLLVVIDPGTAEGANSGTAGHPRG